MYNKKKHIDITHLNTNQNKKKKKNQTFVSSTKVLSKEMRIP